ncbi:MAG: hypothetical protein D6679_09755 [Candidatus Hydrogenedentota bacterium]|nr:MAG: hypothetical protein D6679_09755 [Candidatus Hydrogenedentota bacterium]
MRERTESAEISRADKCPSDGGEAGVVEEGTGEAGAEAGSTFLRGAATEEATGWELGRAADFSSGKYCAS